MRTKPNRDFFTTFEEMQTNEFFMIKGTAETPEVILNRTEGLISFSGRSLPENPRIFYNPIKNWIKNYSESPAEKTKVVFDLEYFNTASSKMILEIIEIIREIYSSTDNLTMEWHYMEDDEDMLEAGEDFSEVADVKFNYFSYN